MKLALCMFRSSMPITYNTIKIPALIDIPSKFYNNPVHLLDRADCETDESHLQLLPYIVLYGPANSVYCYSRGDGSQEARLHGKLSIGLGGHVDDRPDGNIDLHTLLQSEAARELEEEVRIKASRLEFNFTHLIADPTNPVGRVHCGLLTSYHATADQLLGMYDEENQIMNGVFMTLAQLNDPEIKSRLESLPAVVLAHLLDRAGYSMQVNT